MLQDHIVCIDLALEKLLQFYGSKRQEFIQQVFLALILKIEDNFFSKWRNNKFGKS